MAETMPKNNELQIREAATTLLNSHLSHLRSIKDMEMAWLDRYSVITFPAIGFLLAQNPSSAQLSPNLLWIIVSIYLAITLWIQDVLRNERRSYYRVLRSVTRTENYLGLFTANLIPESMANAAFPKGLGPNLNRDGTQPFATFLHRLVYTLIVYTSLVASVIYQNGALLPALALIAVDLAWLLIIFWRDKSDLYREALAEKGLAGVSSSWYPNIPKKSGRSSKTKK